MHIRSPPCARAILRAIVKPNPDVPGERDASPVNCTPRSNIRSRSSTGTPGPLSVTAIESLSDSRLISRMMLSSVGETRLALSIRFVRICAIRVGSPTTVHGVSETIRNSMLGLSSRDRSTSSSTRGSNSNPVQRSSNWPESSRAMSRRSSINCAARRVSFSTSWWRWLSCAPPGLDGETRIASTIARIPAIGVRSSCAASATSSAIRRPESSEYLGSLPVVLCAVSEPGDFLSYTSPGGDAVAPCDGRHAE